MGQVIEVRTYRLQEDGRYARFLRGVRLATLPRDFKSADLATELDKVPGIAMVYLSRAPNCPSVKTVEWQRSIMPNVSRKASTRDRGLRCGMNQRRAIVSEDNDAL